MLDEILLNLFSLLVLKMKIEICGLFLYLIFKQVPMKISTSLPRPDLPQNTHTPIYICPTLWTHGQ